MEKIKVLVVDAREIFREGLVKILERQPNLQVVGTCSTGRQAIGKASQLKPDVVLLDTEISNCEFVEVTRRFYELLPETRVIILTHSEENRDLFSAIRAGAMAYLTKDIKVEDLIRNITRVHAGDVIISPPLASRLIGEFSLLEESKALTEKKVKIGLSKRELEVLSLVVRGATNRDIAKDLFISENTVKVHLSKILEKLHVNNRQQAAILALEKGVISESAKPDK